LPFQFEHLRATLNLLVNFEETKNRLPGDWVIDDVVDGISRERKNPIQRPIHNKILRLSPRLLRKFYGPETEGSIICHFNSKELLHRRGAENAEENSNLEKVELSTLGLLAFGFDSVF
jgi:hypothetical protein